MKKYIVIFSLFFSLSIKSQSFIATTPTFIGQSLLDIKILNARSGNTPSVDKINQSMGEIGLIQFSFNSTNDSINYTFHFRNDTCVSLTVFTVFRSLSDAIMKDIKNKCQEKLSDKAYLQKLNGRNYIWNLPANDKVFVFSTVQNK